MCKLQLNTKQSAREAPEVTELRVNSDPAIGVTVSALILTVIFGSERSKVEIKSHRMQ